MMGREGLSGRVTLEQTPVLKEVREIRHTDNMQGLLAEATVNAEPG